MGLILCAPSQAIQTFTGDVLFRRVRGLACWSEESQGFLVCRCCGPKYPDVQDLFHRFQSLDDKSSPVE